jgi:hypothetical protein
LKFLWTQPMISDENGLMKNMKDGLNSELEVMLVRVREENCGGLQSWTKTGFMLKAYEKLLY